MQLDSSIGLECEYDYGDPSGHAMVGVFVYVLLPAVFYKNFY